ncbi:hypothetical protein DRN74_05125 [Candidatus Micrarchaeota archaeon]|nr:MAG: hypothetical protein DRN74_05125 [Candidatus Micrarchaeota archaeon]
MKIFQISAYFPPFYGGSERYCYNISRRLAEKHEVHVFTSHLSNNPPYEELEGIHVHRVFTLGRMLNINPLAFVLPKIIKQDFDILHAHSYIFFTTYQSAIARALKTFPFLLHLHGGLGEIPKQYSELKYLAKKIYDITVAPFIFRSAERIFSVSSTDIRTASLLFNVPTEKFIYAPNAVEPQLFRKSDYRGPVLFVGRLEEWKGARELPYIIERLETEVQVIGSGSYLKYLKKRYVNSRKVKVMGRLSSEKVREALSHAKLLILPSYMEGLPTVILEAFAAQVPVVAYDVGGVAELLSDNKSGYMCKLGDKDRFIELCQRILADEKLMKRMGREGRKKVEERYSFSKVVEKIEKTYEEVIQ